MATAAQIDANRRNSQKSTGPRTQAGKNRSRINGLDHGCRANILVLPTEDQAKYEQRSLAWQLSMKPRNPAEEFLVDRIVSLSWQSERIERAHTARLTKRIYHATLEEDDRKAAEAIELGQKLFRNACGPRALHLGRKEGDPIQDGETFRYSDYSVDENHPSRLVNRLQRTGAGCKWLLDQWAALRNLLEQGVPWLPSDTLKAVRLLGWHPIDAIDSREVAGVYLASHVLMNQESEPFQEILTELATDEVAVYKSFLTLRRYDELIPEDADTARQILMDMIERATEYLEYKAGVFRELAEIDARTAAQRLSWDDTDEGERLRRYELTCKRASDRSFELLMKIRSTRVELDFGTVASLGRSAPSGNIGTVDGLAAFATNVITEGDEPVGEPGRYSEANFSRENAPTEPNFGVPAPSMEREDLGQEIKSGAIDGQAPFIASVITPSAEPVAPPDSPSEANPVCEKSSIEDNGHVPATGGAGPDIRNHSRHNGRTGRRHGRGRYNGQHPVHQELERQLGSRISPVLNGV
jgi:hypothetical protein